jgi:hypothetical protein
MLCTTMSGICVVTLVLILSKRKHARLTCGVVSGICYIAAPTTALYPGSCSCNIALQMGCCLALAVQSSSARHGSSSFVYVFAYASVCCADAVSLQGCWATSAIVCGAYVDYPDASWLLTLLSMLYVDVCCCVLRMHCSFISMCGLLTMQCNDANVKLSLCEQATHWHPACAWLCAVAYTAAAMQAVAATHNGAILTALTAGCSCLV